MCTDKRGTESRGVTNVSRGLAAPTLPTTCYQEVFKVPGSFDDFQRDVEHWIAGCVTSRTMVRGTDDKLRPAQREKKLVPASPSLMEVWRSIEGSKGKTVVVKADYTFVDGCAQAIRFSLPSSTAPTPQASTPIPVTYTPQPPPASYLPSPTDISLGKAIMEALLRIIHREGAIYGKYNDTDLEWAYKKSNEWGMEWVDKGALLAEIFGVESSILPWFSLSTSILSLAYIVYEIGSANQAADKGRRRREFYYAVASGFAAGLDPKYSDHYPYKPFLRQIWADWRDNGANLPPDVKIGMQGYLISLNGIHPKTAEEYKSYAKGRYYYQGMLQLIDNNRYVQDDPE